MPRIARVVVDAFPYHITQRGNRNQQVFFMDDDYREYLKLLAIYSHRCKLKILAYCLMPNHVHLIVIPEEREGLAKAIGETHRKYTRMINFREKWRGYLWQGRFSSYLLDENYLLSATRYVLLNPVRAGIVKNPQDYKWSSVRHHLGMEKNPLITDEPLNDIINNWAEFLKEPPPAADIKLLKLHMATGRPLGNETFVQRVGEILGINLRKKKPGPKRGAKNN